MNDNDYQERPPISVLRSSANPQADGELKNCFENLPNSKFLFFNQIR